MQYEWDENKNRANIARHGIDFKAANDFEWSTAIEIYDNRIDYGEDRWIVLGLIINRLHVLIYTERSDNIRIISLRKANKKEREYYEAQA